MADSPSKAEGHSRTPLRIQKQPQLLYTMTAPSNYRQKRGSSTPHRERSYCSHTSETTGGGGDNPSTHPPASHAWLASGSPHTASGQRRAATASVIASGHENGERNRGTTIGHSDPPGKHVKAAAMTDRGNSRDRSHQSGF